MFPRGYKLMDSNSKWRFNDIVFFEVCATCGTKVEWQHEDTHKNNQNNFRDFLYGKGWRPQKFMWKIVGWNCEKHK